ncbi:class I SAM-dependent methyltransferase [Novosphingobium lentum]|uniref:class I SAM-dependent methyltransferase n=1 Tax=Novosphingobium lentum TaxID=145287 RepID=UPI0008323674|nr:class I SAM-dependent methyltransferase [Novosphingobium lentum]
MTLSERLAGQLARPSGTAGRLLGVAMDLANRKPTRLAIDLLAPATGERVLDAGCGTGAAMLAMLRSSGCSVTGVDRSGMMVNVAQRRMARAKLLGRSHLYHADIAMLPFAEESFAAVLALNVLYFCDVEGRMMGNLRRMLQPGGRMVAYVTDAASMGDWAFARQGRHRLYDQTSLTRAFIDGGFDRDRVAVHRVAITRSVTGLLACAVR